MISSFFVPGLSEAGKMRRQVCVYDLMFMGFVYVIIRLFCRSEVGIEGRAV